MSASLSTNALHPEFGVEIADVDLRAVTATHLFPEIRAAFEAHSLLLFRDQTMSKAEQLALAELFGPIEDRYPEDRAEGATFEVPEVSNRLKEGGVAAEEDLHTQNLKANQLWHTDSTFLPTPSLANIIMARVVSSTGGETELVSTRAGWRDLPEDLKAQARDAALWHKYAHSRRQISDELAALPMINKWEDQLWRAVLCNPETGAEALYLASHAFAVEGMDAAAGADLIHQLIEFCTQPRYVYAHRWRVGDVLIWDERATMHRGRPWPYAEERTLSSVCVSLTDADGLSTMRGLAA